MNRRAKTRQEIAIEFGISTKTFSRWLKKEKINISNGLITPKDQEKIYEIFGHPIGTKK